MLIASIPSPSSNVFPLLGVRWYGIMIALAAASAVWMARRQYRAAGHDPDLVSDIVIWAIPAGLIGARIYHVITDYNRLYCGTPKCERSLFPDAFYIWEGGLGIPGGIALGFFVGYLAARHYKVDVPDGLDAAAVSIPLAQAVGRLGNWFNQELYGRPTTLPWGLEIDPVYRPLGQYADSVTFHPTFLYEALWNLGLIAVLLAVGRTKKLKAGKLFPLYVAGYGLGRLWVESFRIDVASEIGGLRVNTVMSIVAIVGGVAWFFIGGFRDSEESTAARRAQLPWPESAQATAPALDDAGSDAGPELDGPLSEGGVTDGDEPEADDGVDPDESP